MKYRVSGTVLLNVSCEVKANSPEEAIEKAGENFGGITGYCGNGGHDKLIGVSGRDESVDCNEQVEWKEVEEI